MTRITIELAPGVKPISGWLQQGSEPRHCFEGMLELMSLLACAQDRATEPGDGES